MYSLWLATISALRLVGARGFRNKWLFAADLLSGDKILGGDEYLVGEEDLVLLCCEGDVKEREVIGSSSVLVRVRLEVLVEGVDGEVLGRGEDGDDAVLFQLTDNLFFLKGKILTNGLYINIFCLFWLRMK